MTEEKKLSLHPISKHVCSAYNYLLVTKQVSFALQDIHIEQIDAIVKTVYSNYFGVERFKSIQEKAAAFLCLLIKDHPVVDGNKRLAVLWLEIYCEVSALQLSTSVHLDELAVAIEQIFMPILDFWISAVSTILFEQ